MISKFKSQPLAAYTGRPREIRKKRILTTFQLPVRGMGVCPTISTTSTIVTPGCLLPLPSNFPRHHPNTARLFPGGWISHLSRHIDPNHPTPTLAPLPQKHPLHTTNITRANTASQLRAVTTPALSRSLAMAQGSWNRSNEHLLLIVCFPHLYSHPPWTIY